MNKQHVSLPLSLKSLDEEGRFAGYASVFDVVDGQNDIILRGTFEKTLVGRKTEIKLLWQHQFDEPVGVITQLFEDKTGLFVEGRLQLAVARAREAYALLKSGAVSGLSIGYTPTRFALDDKTGIRRIFEVELWEISLVTFPANAQAQVTLVKGRGGDHCQKIWNDARQKGELIGLCDAIDKARALLS